MSRRVGRGQKAMNTHSTLPLALIPAYEPEVSIVDSAAALLRSGLFGGLLVVDDGSGTASAPLFDGLTLMGAVVLHHVVNQGKGAALRTGFAHVLNEYPYAQAVVTLDADGQHLPEDVLAVTRESMAFPDSLILGCRSFGPGVPLRSRLGNAVTRHVSRLLAGLDVSDTQTGLRAIPHPFLPLLTRLEANGYEFEMDMLMLARRQGIKLREVPISTVYLEGNRSSHFRPLRDSALIYRAFLPSLPGRSKRVSFLPKDDQSSVHSDRRKKP